MKRLAVIGAGGWGTALAIALARRFSSVRLWARDAGHVAEVDASRENSRYLPGVTLPANVGVSSDYAFVLEAAEIVLLAVPSAYLRSVLGSARVYFPRDARIVIATKGIEERSLLGMSAVVAESLPASFSSLIAVLSGPTFAKEIAAGEPAAVVIAAQEIALAEEIQRLFSTATLRFYTSTDVVGVEIGGAVKNVIAIGAGLIHGLGLGSNSVAALITRGLAETTRLAVRLGGQERTLSGLAGLGDLVLTATGDLSRNRFVGLQLAAGRPLEQILAGMKMVAEGLGTCRAAHELGLRHGVELPIVSRMYELLYEGKEPRQAIRELMDRPLTSE